MDLGLWVGVVLVNPFLAVCGYVAWLGHCHHHFHLHCLHLHLDFCLLQGGLVDYFPFCLVVWVEGLLLWDPYRGASWWWPSTSSRSYTSWIWWGWGPSSLGALWWCSSASRTCSLSASLIWRGYWWGSNSMSYTWSVRGTTSLGLCSSSMGGSCALPSSSSSITTSSCTMHTSTTGASCGSSTSTSIVWCIQNLVSIIWLFIKT